MSRRFDAPASWASQRTEWCAPSTIVAFPMKMELWAHTTNGAALGEITFMMPARGTRQSRPVRQQLWARSVEIADGKRGCINATASWPAKSVYQVLKNGCEVETL